MKENLSPQEFSHLPEQRTVRNCAAMLSQIREKLNMPTDSEFITVANIVNDLLET